MLFTEPQVAYKRINTTDAYGTIISTEDVEFSCFIEERNQLGYGDSQIIELGKGIVYTTTDSLTFDTGETLVIYGEEYKIKKFHRARGIDGIFSHWELTYG